MKEHQRKVPRIRAFGLMLACIAMLAIVVFLLAPQLKATIDATREYGAHPDGWVYYVILAGCILVLGGSLFVLFHKEKGGNDRKIIS